MSRYRDTPIITKKRKGIFIPDINDWVRISVNSNVGNGYILPADGTTSYARGASFPIANATQDFRLEFNCYPLSGGVSFNNGDAMFGFDNSDPDFQFGTIDHAIYFDTGNAIAIYENGTRRANVGVFVISDLFAIERIGGVVKFYKNTTLLYTSTIPSNTSVVFDSTIIRNYGAENIKVIYL